MARISMKQMADLCYRLDRHYRAGLDLRSIWQREADIGSPEYRRRARTIANQLEAGQSLAEAMREQRGYFSPLSIAVTSAGERGGRLEDSFRLLSEHYRTLVRFRTEVLYSLASPIFNILGAIVVIGLLILVMDFVIRMGGGQPIDWFGWGWTTRQYFLLFVLAVLSIATLGTLTVLGTVQGWFGPIPMQIGRRIPVVGKVLEDLAQSRFAWALAVVVDAGINVKEGVRLAFAATENAFFSELEDEVTERLQAGSELTEALRSTGRFPDDFLAFVETGEIAGELPESLQKLAEDYLERIQGNLKLLSRIAFFAGFVLVMLMMVAMIVILFRRLILDPIDSLMTDLAQTVPW